ncbi:pseudaminic acid cytidylyltransferase [Candidatus Pelagibacter sp.]|nr:pseudaminic acid cytidylyltransferase [Candidatus Pelagibacter sp.]
MKNICLIPARSGSKRIKNKNIIDFHGKPLIYRAIHAAKISKLFTEIYISTDSKNIFDLSKKYKVKCILRSRENSNDTATIHSVIKESIIHLRRKNIKFDNLCCILPTAVLLNYKNLIKAYNLLKNNKLKFIMPISKFSYPPQRGLVIKNNSIFMQTQQNYNKNSQEFEKIYHDAGQFYWGNAKSFLKYNNTFNGKSIGLILKSFEVQDIDDVDDLILAKMKFKNLYK